MGTISFTTVGAAGRVDVVQNELKNTFLIKGMIARSGDQPPVDFADVKQTIQARYSQAQEMHQKESHLLVTTEAGTKVGVGIDKNLLYVVLGEGKNGFHRWYADPTYTYNQLTLPEASSLFTDFAGVYEALVNGIYHTQGKQLDVTNFPLSVPEFEQKVDIPSGLKEKIDVKIPDISFDDIGGQEDAKRQLREMQLGIERPDIFSKHGITPPKGGLLYGPPGTGKTMLARALASECDALFVNVSFEELTSKYYGETEKSIKDIFRWANEMGEKTPVILFFDEVDRIARSRENAHEATASAQGVFLTSMDGFAKQGNVTVIGATNKPEILDSAFTRPGRLNHIINVALPDQEGRSQTLAVKMNEIDKNATSSQFSDVSMRELASQTEGFSGADLTEVLRRAVTQKIMQEVGGETPSPVTTADLLHVVQLYKEERNMTTSNPHETLGYL